MAIKLRYPHSLDSTPANIELLNNNLWIIENALNSVGAVTPAPGGGVPITPPGTTISHHSLLDLTNFDDHIQYLYLAGRLPNQTITSITTNTTLPSWLFQDSIRAGGSVIQINASSNVSHIDFRGITGSVLGLSISSAGYVANVPSGLSGLTLKSTGIVAFNAVGGSSITLDAVLINLRGQTTIQPSVPVNNGLIIKQGEGSAQTVDLLQIVERFPATNNVLAGLNKLGAYFLVAGAGTGKVYTSDANGVGSWAALPAGSTVFKDNVFQITDDIDISKILMFQLAGFTTGTTRTLTPPNASGTIALLELEQTFTAAQSITGSDVNAPLLTLNAPVGQINNIMTVKNGLGVTVAGINGQGDLQGTACAIYDLVTGFTCTLEPDSSTFIQGQTILVPGISDPGATATMVLTSLSGVKFSVLLGTNTIIYTLGTTTGPYFADNTTPTKRFRVSLAGSVGNNALVVQSTAARTYTLPDATGGIQLILFSQTNSQTVTNTVTETTILGTGVGSLTLPANFFIAGRTVRLRIGGIYTTPLAATPSIIIKVKYGSTVIATVTTSALLSGATNLEFDGEIAITCRTTGASGSVVVHGDIEYATGVGGTIAVDSLNNAGAATTINTTTSNAINITVQWDTATSTRSVTSVVTVMEVLN